ncbi:MAG TPA: DUF2846 domain-containing protein [Burkholderiaceae bacterium]|nr:DUF2846 domain-containing protein [Burkholderiaceae bacterium]HMX10489.1 DUF2846 domain-containing protein [Burkholderiaceae bacterium]HMY99835.1 DUF2846 domain-containing protein [Burkholderiaceae bacterium]HNB43642.1 DUF2846 domain-containing protein [Burkholderiaceae bacterium]HNG77876.1 DUF2846 domain-containing protein [Burkholderiaceae bacterium]
MTRRITSGLSCALAALLLSACTSIQVADPGRNAEAKKFAAKPAVGQIYVCRGSSMFGAGVRPTIELDGKAIGVLGRGNFAYAEVAPGEHTVIAKTLEHDSKMPFTIAAGEQKFFQTWISIGVIAGRGVIDTFSAEEGRACVTGGEMVDAPPAGK